MIRVSLVHLGCARNQVDSEVILGHLVNEGLQIAADPEQANVVIINTCSFIGPARDESFAAIRDSLAQKQQGKLKAVLVAGCLAQKFQDLIQKEAPGVDAILPLSDYSGISQVVRKAFAGEDARACPGGRPKDNNSDQLRLLTTPGSYAYLRISEGCDHTCTFCIIPAIRGPMRSKPIQVLLQEAQNLAALGVKELVLVAEDSTWYGRDLAQRPLLPQLVSTLAKVPGIEWIRILYAYPNSFPWELTRVMREQPKVLPYLDIPIQHIADGVLQRMRRAGSGEQVRKILTRLREEVPQIVLRTTVMTGFPGESEQDFATLLQFLEDFQFERLGAFAFSDEDKADSYKLSNKVASHLGQQRQQQIMQLQARLIEQRNRRLIGQELDVLIDSQGSGNSWMGRSKADAPEVDCAIILHGKNLKPGKLGKAKVTGVSKDGYDLIGSWMEQSL